MQGGNSIKTGGAVITYPGKVVHAISDGFNFFGKSWKLFFCDITMETADAVDGPVDTHGHGCEVVFLSHLIVMSEQVQNPLEGFVAYRRIKITCAKVRINASAWW